MTFDVDDDQTKKDKPGENDETVIPLASEESKGNLDGIADDLADDMPQPSAHAINAAEAEKTAEAEKIETYAHLKDRDGNSFDPSIHQVHEDGSPKTNAKDVLLKKRGRKKGVALNSSVVAPHGGGGQGMQSLGQSQEELAKQATALESGRAAANLVFALGISLGGEEWQPVKDAKTGLDEESQLSAAFGQYFLATGKTDIPPGWALAISLGSYSLPRFTMPKTQTRAKSVWQKIKAWRMNRKADKAIEKDKE